MVWNQLAVIFLVSSAGLVCYLDTLKAEFVYDDNRAIIENSDIRPETSWVDIWYNDFWGTPLSHSGSHKSYRPLCVLSFRINHMLDGLNPKWYHLGNILLHSIVCGLFTVLAFTLLRNTTQCLLASMLFAVHPIHSEAVAGIVGRADVGCGLFFILSLLMYQKATNTWKFNNENRTHSESQTSNTNTWLFLLSVICCVVSILCKEIGITALGLMITYDVIIIMEPRCKGGISSMVAKASKKGTLQRTIILFITGILLLYLRISVMNHSSPIFSSSDNPASDHPDVIVRFLTFLYLPVFNVSLLLFPWQLSFDWSMESIPLITTINDPRNGLSLFLYLSLIFFAYKFIKINNIWIDGDTIDIGNTDSDNPWDSRSQKFKMKNSKNTSFPRLNGNYYCRLPQNPFANGCLKQSLFRKFTSGYLDPVPDDDVIIKNGSSNQNGRLKQNGRRNDLYTVNEKNGCIYKENFSIAHDGGGRSEKIVDKKHISNGSSFQNGGCNIRKRNGGVKDSFSKDNYEDDVHETQNNDYSLTMFLLAMMVIPFLPATNLFFYVGFVVAERILYIPSMGFCLLVAFGFGKINKRFHHLKPIFNASALILIGLFAVRTLIRNEDWFDEESLYRSGLKINPPKAWGNLANILLQNGRIAEAEVAYKTAIKHRPNMADTHYNLGILLQNSKRYEEAIEFYKNAIKYRPSLASAYLNLGLTYDAIGHKHDAIKILLRGKNLSDFGLKNPKAHLHSLTTIRYTLGKILFSMQDFKASVDMFHEAIEIAPSSYSSHSIYNMLGQAYSFLGQTENAGIWYWKSLQSNTTHVPAHLTYARHLASKGRTEEAERWFLKALKLQPNHPDTHFHYGQFLISVGRPQDGLTELERAVELNPNEAELVAFTASSFREAKDYEKAEKYYKMAISLNAQVSQNHMNLGALYHLTGRLDEAELSYFEALRLNPNDDLTIDNIRKLKSLKRQ